MATSIKALYAMVKTLADSSPIGEFAVKALPSATRTLTDWDGAVVKMTAKEIVPGTGNGSLMASADTVIVQQRIRSAAALDGQGKTKYRDVENEKFSVNGRAAERIAAQVAGEFGIAPFPTVEETPAPAPTEKPRKPRKPRAPKTSSAVDSRMNADAPSNGQPIAN
jgi:hypothetical protein